jgi:transcriptional regulator with AAA-type ATPase domain
VCTADIAAWLADIRELIGGSDTVVLKDVDALGEPYLAALADLLESDARRAPVVAILERGHYLPGVERLGMAVMRVPPLRERREDIPDLVYAALRETRHPSARVGHRAMAALMAYAWPGNLAQLRAAVTDAAEAARGADVDVAHLPEELRACAAGRRKLTRIEEVERDAITAAMLEHRGNKNRVAAALGLSRSTLYRRLRRFGIDGERTVI